MPKALKDADWNLDTFLEVHYLLLHRSAKQRWRGIEALLALADRDLKPLSVSPLELLKDVIVPFTFGSGAAPIIFLSLAQLNTPAADEALKQILRGSEGARNEDFRKFIEIAIAEGKPDLLRVLDTHKLSQSKSAILRELHG